MTSAHSDPAIEALRVYDEPVAEHLRNLLWNDKLEKREKWRNLLNDPIFDPKFEMPLN